MGNADDYYSEIRAPTTGGKATRSGVAVLDPSLGSGAFLGRAEASALAAYAGTQAAAFTHGQSSVALEDMPGDARKVAQAMIRIGDSDQPPRRQLLGSDAYALVREALQTRLDAVDAQRDVAKSTDRDGFVAALA